MLPAAARMRRPAEFTAAVRTGARAGSHALSVHLTDADPHHPTRVGLVVARQVGSAVVRNRVRRRLRHLLRERLAALPSGAALVVRAHPASSGLTSAGLGIELDRALSRARARTAPPVGQA